MSAATKDSLNDLHSALALELAAAIKEKELKVIEIPDEASEGGKKRVAVHTRNAAVLSVARQFLKDNGIEALAVPGSPLKSLVDSLPFAGRDPISDEDAAPGTTH